jgi:hypothetical protein
LPTWTSRSTWVCSTSSDPVPALQRDHEDAIAACVGCRSRHRSVVVSRAPADGSRGATTWC